MSAPDDLDLNAEDIALAGLHRAGDSWSSIGREIEREINPSFEPPQLTSPEGQKLAAPPAPVDLPLIATPQQAADSLGVTEQQVRLLMHEGRIARVRIGKRDLIPRPAIERFVTSNTVEPSTSWRAETTAQSSTSASSAAPGTSPGPKAVAAASAQRALQTANKLRSLSPSGSTSAPAQPAARVIPLLITDALCDYAEEHGPTTAAPWRIAYAITALTAFWEGRAVGDISRQTCSHYVKARGRAAGTTRRELGVLAAAISHAHGEGRLTRTVVVHLPESAEPRDRWLTQKEAAALLRAALREPRVRCYLPLFILIGLRCGARKEAILQLRWPQVDLERGRISFKQPGAKVSNKRRAHQVPIPSKLLGHLKRARARSGSDLGFVVHDNGARLGDVKRAFGSACRRAGLKGVTPHVLRHTAATWKAQARVPMWEAAGFLGMTEETLRRVYAHHDPDHLREAAEAHPLTIRASARRPVGGPKL
jgi:excisionase family DNA binding protein